MDCTIFLDQSNQLICSFIKLLLRTYVHSLYFPFRRCREPAPNAAGRPARVCYFIPYAASELNLLSRVSPHPSSILLLFYVQPVLTVISHTTPYPYPYMIKRIRIK